METNSQFNNDSQPEPKKNWFLKHEFLYLVIGGLLLVVIAGSVYWWKIEKQTTQNLAKSSQTNNCPTSPELTPCQDNQITKIPDNSKPSDTSTWKTYVSKKYGISYIYPSNWQLSEREGDLSGSIHDIDLSVDNDIKTTVRINSKADYDYSANSTTGKTILPITIGGKSGQRYKYYHVSGNYIEMQDYVIVPVDPYVFEISLYISDADYKSGKSQDLQNNFEQILTNFKLLKADPLASDPNVVPNNQIISSITDWNSYQKSDIKIDGDSCNDNDPQFPALLDKINTGNIYEKEINYHWVFYTPNYDKWSTDRFIKNGFCEAGAIATVYAYPDKLIWEGPCDGKECTNAQKVSDDYFQSLIKQ